MAFPSSIAAVPHRLPLLGHMVSLLRDPLAFLSSLPTHGDLVRIGLGPVTAVAVCDPALTQELLRRDRVFDKGGPLLERVREALGDGLVTCPHSLHRRHRRLVQPAFPPGPDGRVRGGDERSHRRDRRIMANDNRSLSRSARSAAAFTNSVMGGLHITPAEPSRPRLISVSMRQATFAPPRRRR
ncbi:hypothetical protein KHQ06_29900 [Nocardia tengchongensis]|uniref:Cytochrome P450 n=1 Tax=Nocardia tengchongensis TaxID=2055889 RepID=A0ABX8CK75_9NOCA|nr:hypothetical protein [Nocardia tengchongensis]QVI20361.1 hypothetical protein KHQ06_29900 [Nocardia tengchongensis]